VGVPDVQRPVAPHQPQGLIGAQSAQVVKRLHGSVLPTSVLAPASGVGAAVHSRGSHAKPPPHAPPVGPDDVLDTQRLEAPHQPQPLTGVQPAHDV
jgi:hypothetical protein